MQLQGPLMIEHRLIERFIRRLEKTLQEIDASIPIDPDMIDEVVDFMGFYADKTHHGKEEDILFMELEGKDLSNEERSLMQELIEEHRFGRRVTRELLQANDRFRNGEDEALLDIAERLRTLVEFYPQHIDREDKVLFPACQKHFTESEEQRMLQEFRDADSRIIHQKYRDVVAALEQQ